MNTSPYPPHVPMAECGASTPKEELERQIMDSTLPKNEREWWAKREIERLRSALNPVPGGQSAAIANDRANHKLYDPKCQELAYHFLTDGDPASMRYAKSLAEERFWAEDLAAHIQQAVEDWFVLRDGSK